MGRSATNALILWIATALSIVALVAGFNIVVDPFGYFGRNTIGYYFSSERQFKYSVVKSYDYNAIVLGDSRIAYTDTSQINRLEYTFVNGGIGGASLAELVALLSASRLNQLKLVVFGLQFGDLQNCSEDAAPTAKVVTVGPREYGSWDAVRFAASFTQLAYAMHAVMARARGLSPRYLADGTRSVVSKQFEESTLDGKTKRYWEKIEKDVPEGPRDPHYELEAGCRQLLSEARALSDRHGFALMVVFLPTNGDLLKHLNLDTPQARKATREFLAQVEEVVPHVVDLSISSFSDSQNFWLDDSMHFKPATGALVVQEAINRSIGVQAGK